MALSRRGRLLPHSIDHALSWHLAGFLVVVVVVVERLSEEINIESLRFAAGVLVRENHGYDFGAWASVIDLLADSIDNCAVVAVANDSVVGPSAKFFSMLNRAEQAGADVVGLTESCQFQPHLQSFVVFFKRNAITSSAFNRFWRRIRSGDRDYVIRNYEIKLRAYFERAGLRTIALFPLVDKLEITDHASLNPTLDGWRELLDAGFPYLKIELLRNNPRGQNLDDWRRIAAVNGFRLDRLDYQLAALVKESNRPWAFEDAS